MSTLALLPHIGMPELIILAILGLLIFGRRLPEVGRGLGRSIVEFRKGLKGVEDEIEHASSEPVKLPDRDKAGQGPVAGAASGVPGTVAQHPATPSGPAQA